MSETPNMQARPIPQPIVPPDNFPVTWEHPSDASLHWTHDRMHSVGPSKPAELSAWRIRIGGMDAVFTELGMARKSRVQSINTYAYMANTAPPPDPKEMAARMEENKDQQREMLGRLQELWDNQWLPEIQAHLAFWENFDLENAAMSDLITHLDETRQHMERLWTLHFEIVLPAGIATEQFENLYEELFGSDDAFGAYSLLEGLSNKTMEIGLALWRLSREALADADVCTALTQGEASGARARLQRSASGGGFLAHVDQFLDEYGQRSSIWGITSPSWLEDPTPVFITLREYVQQPERDLEQEMLAAAARREERTAEVRSLLAGYPQAVADQFEFLLKAAQTATILQEDHGFWIDYRGDHMVRRVLLEFGRRFAEAGVIDVSDDVFYLEWDEVRAAAITLPHVNHRDLIATRKAEEERFAQIEPPPALGAPPAQPDPPAEIKFWGGPPPKDQSPEHMRGNPGSPGTVRGPVKVVRYLKEAEKIEPGDVLVAVTTAPPWTPLFAVAAAVVTDTGGVLSHCAVVAREYGIPAVVGTGSATSLLQDGQIVEVDGRAGTVRLVG